MEELVTRMRMVTEGISSVLPADEESNSSSTPLLSYKKECISVLSIFNLAMKHVFDSLIPSRETHA